MGKAIIYGLLAAVLDAAVLLNTATVAGYFTVSEWYLATVLVVAAFLLHLALVRNLWTALRVRAIIRAPHRSSRQAQLPNRRSQNQSRPRVYINP